ncbi:MAG: class I SAM-dependent methyltransferase [Thermodesulfovibrio sp.]|nr:class I SAM-dependent methyltransferase [Thermodesulfovibrio sp.]
MNTTQKKLFKKYKELRANFLDADDIQMQKFFNNLLKYHYLKLKYIHTYKNKKILEIGCGRGFLLKALKDEGFKHLYGIDLSSGNVEDAIKRTNLHTIKCCDAFEELRSNTYDVIIAKAVMEHIHKQDQEKFVELIYNSLNDGGIALIAVPNMDWILSNHERYMDFTHEIGYTRESLGDIFRLYFKPENIEIVPVCNVFPEKIKGKLVHYIFRPLVVKFLRLIFKILGECASDVWFEYREIMIAAKK